MLKHLKDGAMGKFLDLYNRVWEEGRLPNAWKEAIIIPIRKPGKDPSKPSNYRPIALTSNICKLMERMVTDRLTYLLEKRGILTKYQSGFRKGRGTMDPVVCLENEIRKAQVNKESVIAVFFDVEKAYDMMWTKGLLIKLKMMNIDGRIYNWIKDFMAYRSIQVRIGNELSNRCEIENGTPQGSVISPLIFSIMINDVFNQVQQQGVGRSLFADDGALWKRGRNILYINGRMQEAIRRVEEWAGDWGFKFSVEKTKTIIFSRKRIIPEINLKMYGRSLERVRVFKFLGIYFDSKLTWVDHINKVIEKCQKVLNIMRCVSGVAWGASFLSLKTIYVALIRSVFDYGSVVYGSASKTLLEKLDKIQAQALRQCCGAVKTTPIPSLQVLLGEIPLEMRRKQLMINYWANLKGHKDDHPTKMVLMKCWEQNKLSRKSFGWSSEAYVEEMEVNRFKMSPTVVIPENEPWSYITPHIDLQLLEIKKAERKVDMSSAFSEHFRTQYSQYLQIFTDGSKDPERETTGAAFLVPDWAHSIKRTSNHLAVYTVEMIAILLSLQWVEDYKPGKVLICSDSLSVLKSLRSFKSSHQDILFSILQIYSRLVQNDILISFIWVPSHVGVKGNEDVDKLAKQALQREEIELQVPLSKSEIKVLIWKKVIAEWQIKWDNNEKGRFFYNLINKVSQKIRHIGKTRKEEVVYNRILLGHSNLNSTLKILGKHPNGLCEQCKVEETVTHVILECKKYEEERSNMIVEIKKNGIQVVHFKSLIKWASEINSKAFFHFLKRTGLISRM
uniref:Uncharacterized LOC107721237 n=1 Tax=Sinocyclocheilus rhinocerous TaxID=307959 RepID=A0A673MAK6_9TELE